MGPALEMEISSFLIDVIRTATATPTFPPAIITISIIHKTIKIIGSTFVVRQRAAISKSSNMKSLASSGQSDICYSDKLIAII
jgi:hypothetical protein